MALLPPLLLIVALTVFPSGCGGSSGATATPTPTMGFVEIGFVDSPTSDFQRILLNVVDVRINPSTDPNVPDTDPNWQTIPAPSGVGQLGVLQVDLNAIQNQVQVFNTGAVPAQHYNQLEVLLDPNRPGDVVPNCPQTPATNEGCLTYRFDLAAGNALRVSQPFEVADHGFSPIVIDFNPGTPTPPTGAGGPYTLDPTLTVVSYNGLMGQVTGKITGEPQPVNALVTAELSGTNSIIAQGYPNSGGIYTLELPAGAAAGTLYDVFVTGGGGSYAAQSAVPVTRGGSAAVNFTVTSQSTSSVAGIIADKTTGLPIQGATVNLLIPAQGSKAGTNCWTTNPTPPECVVVATANTDESGFYPLPGNIYHEPPFNSVPLGSYGVQVSAAGYDLLPARAVISTQGQSATCGVPPVLPTSNCNFSLTSNTISGTVLLDVPPAAGSEVQALVTAEDSGTNKLENVTMVTIPAGATSAGFSINVPTSLPSCGPAPLPPCRFDLFDSAVDFFEGLPSPFPGHTIEVLPNVAPTTGQDFPPMTCVGHGSLSGTAVSGDSGTTVVLRKSAGPNDVQLFTSQVGPSYLPGGCPNPSCSNPNAGQFSFCAPPDNYTLQRYEMVGPTGSPSPVGTPVAVTINAPSPTVVPTPTAPAPTVTPTPCPLCRPASGSCPGICQNTSGPTL